MKYSDMVIIPSKSRYDLELEIYGNIKDTDANFKSEQILKRVKESHLAQKENIKRVADVIGYDKIIDRSSLNPEVISDKNIFVFLGGDNHFTYCAQEILKFMKQNNGEEKQVIGCVLDPAKSYGGLLYFDVDKLLESLPELEKGNYLIENWTSLEADINNKNGRVASYPAVGDYFVGERERLLMSRNRVYLDGDVVLPEKSSGLLIAVGPGSGNGSWYDNVHNLMFGCSDEFGREEDFARIILTENKSRSKLTLSRGQILTIDSYNDDCGVISPDSHRDHSADFHMGAQAEVRISDLKLPVVKPIQDRMAVHK